MNVTKLLKHPFVNEFQNNFSKTPNNNNTINFQNYENKLKEILKKKILEKNSDRKISNNCKEIGKISLSIKEFQKEFQNEKKSFNFKEQIQEKHLFEKDGKIKINFRNEKICREDKCLQKKESMQNYSNINISKDINFEKIGEKKELNQGNNYSEQKINKTEETDKILDFRRKTQANKNIEENIQKTKINIKKKLTKLTLKKRTSRQKEQALINQFSNRFEENEILLKKYFKIKEILEKSKLKDHDTLLYISSESEKDSKKKKVFIEKKQFKSKNISPKISPILNPLDEFNLKKKSPYIKTPFSGYSNYKKKSSIKFSFGT
jgi:hypothetical protein